MRGGYVTQKFNPNNHYISIIWFLTLSLALLSIIFGNGIMATIWVATGFVVLAIDKTRKEVKKHMSELSDALDFVTGKLEEASAEIINLISSLQNPAITPVEREKLNKVIAIATALADIVPNAPVEPPVEPPV
jgi:hypothetical protein